MFFDDDTFPVRRSHLALPPNIKITPSSDSPNFPLSHISSPKPVTHVCRDLPARSQALRGSLLQGAGWMATGTSRAFAGGYNALLPPWTVQQERVVSACSILQPLPHPQPLPKGSCCQCIKDAAAASSLYSSLSTNFPSPCSRPRAPRCTDPNPPCTQVVGFHLLASYEIFCAPTTLREASLVRAVKDFSSPAQCLLLYTKHYITSEMLIPSQNALVTTAKGEALHNPLHLLASISQGWVCLSKLVAQCQRQCSKSVTVSLTHYVSSPMLLQHTTHWVLPVRLACNRHKVLF